MLTTVLFLTRNDGLSIQPRVIKYLNERFEHEDRWTGAIEKHPSAVTVIWGDAAPVEHIDMAEKFLKRRPDAHLERMRGIGHVPMIETPDRYIELLREGIERVTS